MNPDDVLAAAYRPKPHRHRWLWLGVTEDGDPCETCHCGARKDTAKSRRGKSAARFGKDQERRIERVYGPTKVGEFNDAIDLIGHDWKWQSKATRGALPVWARGIDAWAPIEAHRWITDPIEHMDPLHRDLAPLLIKTWVRQGVQPIDIIIVRSSDWAVLHGGPAPSTEYMAMTGTYFLDINGLDRRTAS